MFRSSTFGVHLSPHKTSHSPLGIFLFRPRTTIPTYHLLRRLNSNIGDFCPEARHLKLAPAASIPHISSRQLNPNNWPFYQRSLCSEAQHLNLTPASIPRPRISSHQLNPNVRPFYHLDLSRDVALLAHLDPPPSNRKAVLITRSFHNPHAFLLVVLQR